MYVVAALRRGTWWFYSACRCWTPAKRHAKQYATRSRATRAAVRLQRNCVPCFVVCVFVEV